ncbi:predicted protein [Streptomyces sp. C]|nr:predicted protein [Streptomyces sp. C]
MIDDDEHNGDGEHVTRPAPRRPPLAQRFIRIWASVTTVPWRGPVGVSPTLPPALRRRCRAGRPAGPGSPSGRPCPTGTGRSTALRHHRQRRRTGRCSRSRDA